MSKQTKTYGIIVLGIILLGISIIAFDTQSVFTEEIIKSTTHEIEREIGSYLNPISVELHKIKSDRKSDSFNYRTEAGLNNYFIPILAKFSNISSIKYFDYKGRQYFLHKEKATYVSTFRIEKTFNNEVIWKRWKSPTDQISKWKETVEEDPVRLNWLKYFKKDARTDSIFWFNLSGFSEISTEEVSAVTFGKSDSTQKIFGLAIGIKVAKLIGSIPEVKLYSNPKIFLINHNLHILPIVTENDGTSRGLDKAFTRENIHDSVVISLFDMWQELGRDSVSTFQLNINNDRWWAQVEPINMHLSKLQLGVVVTEADLIFANLFDTYVIIGFLLLVLILITIIYIRRRFRKKAVSSDRLSVKELQKFLNEGESERFELKSSLRWDYREEKVNKKLEEVIVKSISAFNNANGGYLVIGIDDDNKILGLKNDYSTLKKGDADYFELHLRNLISSTFTVRYAARKLAISFLILDGKEICVIKISKGEYPLFLKTSEKNGNKIEKFYIRSGNSSQEITTLTEINNYIRVRFKKE